MKVLIKSTPSHSKVPAPAVARLGRVHVSSPTHAANFKTSRPYAVKARDNFVCKASSQHSDPSEEPEISSFSNSSGSSNVLPGFLWAAVPLPFALPLIFGGDGGNNGRIFGGGGDGGDGGSSNNGPLNEVAVIADASDEEEEGTEEDEERDEDEEDMTEDEDGSEEEGDEGEVDPEIAAAGGFFCGEVHAQGLPVGEGIPTEEDLFASLNCQPGFACNRAELSQDIKQLYNTGLFESVNARVLPAKKGKFQVVFDFSEKRYPEIKTFNVEGSKVLPKPVVAEVQAKLESFKGQAFTMETMATIKNIIEGWYQARGFGLSYISHFTGMPTGDVVAHIVEGRTAKVGVVYVDEDGNPTKFPGSIPQSYILKHCPVEVGTLYNMNDGRKTLQNVFALDLFDNVQVFPHQNEKDPSRVDVDVMVREKPVQTADLEMEWQVAPGDNNRPALVSLIPGGTITYEHRNLGGRAATMAASVNTKNFLAPSDDLSYRLMYSLPYLNGLDDPKRTKLTATLFNARKMCGVFTAGPSGEEVPPVWVDRTGAKVAISEQYSRNSRGSLGLVLQEVVTRDESGAPCARGMRATPFGQYVADGPPTTLSGTGKDKMLYAQGALTRDTTFMVNGQQIGSRDIFAVDQGLGLGTKAPLFNRLTAAATRFIQLKGPAANSNRPPITLIAHGRMGNTIGDLPVYDSFLLGGPYSVRGYNIGELAACRRYVEAAVEARVPVFGQQVYAFYELGHDLGSSKEVSGNPTEYFRRVGQGSSTGAGVKLGAMRAEAVRDNNKGKWHALLSYGERF